DGNFVAYERVGQRRLADVGSADEAGESGPEIAHVDSTSTTVAPLGPSSATNTGTPPPARSRTASIDTSSLITAAASRLTAPDETAIATAKSNALMLNDGRE